MDCSINNKRSLSDKYEYVVEKCDRENIANKIRFRIEKILIEDVYEKDIEQSGTYLRL